jgi:regulator of sirC expression with transglutaminase-like and TPR domain
LSVAADLTTLLAAEPVDLAELALAIARLDTPRLDARSTRTALDQLTARARVRLAEVPAGDVRTHIAALNAVVFGPDGFRGNRSAYDDVRNSLLPAVMERRLGIPITLAVVYITIARRAGFEVFGVAFPGHFLMRVPNEAGGDEEPIILDPFDGGRVLSRPTLGRLLGEHVDGEAIWSDDLLLPCSSRQIAIRMLNNLKRLYVALRDFDHAWRAADALVAIDAGDPEHRRDRGLLAFHLDRFTDALNDLEAYVRATDTPNEGSDQRSQLWDHITSLRRRVAGMN